MHVLDSIRVSLLGNPLRLDDAFGALSILFYSLLDFVLFELFFLAVVALAMGTMVLFLVRKSVGTREYFIYVAGAVIIFSALNYKFVSNTVNMDAALHSARLTSFLENSLLSLGSSLMGLFASFFRACQDTTGEFSLLPGRAPVQKSFLSGEAILISDGKVQTADLNTDKTGEEEKKERIIERIGKLLGNSTVVRVSAKADGATAASKKEPENGTGNKRKKGEKDKNEKKERDEHTRKDKNDKNERAEDQPADNSVGQSADNSADKDQPADKDEKMATTTTTTVEVTDQDQGRIQTEDNTRHGMGTESIGQTTTPAAIIKTAPTARAQPSPAGLSSRPGCADAASYTGDHSLRPVLTGATADGTINETDNCGPDTLADENTPVIDIYDSQRGDSFIMWVLNVLNAEFAANDSMSLSLRESRKKARMIHRYMKEFRGRFDDFYKSSMCIEQEMASFNASPKYFEQEANELVRLSEEAVGLLRIIEHLGQRETTDRELRNIFPRHKSRPASSRSDRYRTLDSLYLMRACMCIQIILGFILLIFTICEIEPTFVPRFLISLFLLLNVAFGFYMLVIAQIMDKRCILGTVEGCGSSYSRGFTEFATATNLGIGRSNFTDRIDSSMVRMEKRSNEICTVLRAHLARSPDERFKYKAQVFQNFFDRINFVRDDFVDLTDNKIDKDKYFTNVEVMKQLIDRTKNLIDLISKEEIVDLYRREVVFGSFLQTERRRISQYVLEQVNGPSTREGSEKCLVKKRVVCELKNSAQRLAFFMVAGGLILMVLLAL